MENLNIERQLQFPTDALCLLNDINYCFHNGLQELSIIIWRFSHQYFQKVMTSSKIIYHEPMNDLMRLKNVMLDKSKINEFLLIGNDRYDETTIYIKDMIRIISLTGKIFLTLNSSRICIEILHEMNLLSFKKLRIFGLKSDDWKSIQVPRSKIPCADFSDMNLSDANLRGSNLQYANLTNTSLINTDLREVYWGNPISLNSKRHVNYVAFSPCHRFIALAYCSIEIWSLQTKELLTRFEISGWVRHLQFSPDSSDLVSICDPPEYIAGDDVSDSEREDKIITLWSIHNTTRPFCVYRHPKILPTITYAVRGKYLVSACHDKIQLWSARTGKYLDSLKVLRQIVTISSLSNSGGNKVAVVTRPNWINIYSIQDNRLYHTQSIETPGIYQMTVSTSGNIIACTFEGKIVLYSYEFGSCLMMIQASHCVFSTIQFSPDERTFAIQSDKGGYLQVYSVVSGKCLYTFMNNRFSGKQFSFSSDGSIIAGWGALFCDLKFWEVRDLPKNIEDEPLQITELVAARCNLHQSIGLSPKIFQRLKDVGATGEPRRIALNSHMYRFFGHNNSYLPTLLMLKILQYLPLIEFNRVIPLVCALWRDVSWSHQMEIKFR